MKVFVILRLSSSRPNYCLSVMVSFITEAELYDDGFSPLLEQVIAGEVLPIIEDKTGTILK